MIDIFTSLGGNLKIVCEIAKQNAIHIIRHLAQRIYGVEYLKTMGEKA